jgi:hypothetical protein
MAGALAESHRNRDGIGTSLQQGKTGKQGTMQVKERFLPALVVHANKRPLQCERTDAQCDRRVESKFGERESERLLRTGVDKRSAGSSRWNPPDEIRTHMESSMMAVPNRSSIAGTCNIAADEVWEPVKGGSRHQILKRRKKRKYAS